MILRRVSIICISKNQKISGDILVTCDQHIRLGYVRLAGNIASVAIPFLVFKLNLFTKGTI